MKTTKTERRVRKVHKMCDDHHKNFGKKTDKETDREGALLIILAILSAGVMIGTLAVVFGL